MSRKCKIKPQENTIKPSRMANVTLVLATTLSKGNLYISMMCMQNATLTLDNNWALS